MPRGTPKFKLREKPKKPIHAKKTHRFDVEEGMTLERVIEYFSGLGANPRDVHVGTDGYYESMHYYFYASVFESEFEYNKKLEKYKLELENFKKWEKDNEDNIRKYFQEQEETAKQKRDKAIEIMARDIEKKQKELDKLKKTYQVGNLDRFSSSEDVDFNGA